MGGVHGQLYEDCIEKCREDNGIKWVGVDGKDLMSH